MDRVSFQARRISPAFVMKKVDGTKMAAHTYFVEFEPAKSTRDLKAINKLWWTPSIMPDMYDDFLGKKNRIFGVIEQEKNFEKPNFRKILGLIFISNKGFDSNSIEKIRIKPAEQVNLNKLKSFFGIRQKENDKVEYFNVNNALIQGVQRIFKRLEAYTILDQDLYRHNGFDEEISNFISHFIWRKGDKYV